MRMLNNYSNGYNLESRMNEIRGLSNEYGLNLNGIKKEYYEEKIIKPKCNHRYKETEKKKNVN